MNRREMLIGWACGFSYVSLAGLTSQSAFQSPGEREAYNSALFPHLSKQSDRPARPQAAIQMHTGSFNFVRPSVGAWVVYGPGPDKQEMPGFITINPAGLGGAHNYGSAFLPASYEGTPYLTRTGKLPNIF